MTTALNNSLGRSWHTNSVCHSRESGNPRARYRKIVPVLSLVLLCAVLACLPGCDADPTAETTTDSALGIEREHAKGPLVVRVQLDRSSISIAETVNLRLEADIQSGYDVKMPPLAEVLGKYEFGILDYRALPDQLLDDDHLLLVREYRLEPILSGEYTISPLTFTFTERSADDPAVEPRSYELVTDAITLEVTSLLDEDRDDLTLADIKNVVPLARRYNFTWAWIVAAVLALALALLIWFLRRIPAAAMLKRIFKPAHELAYQKLRQLEQEDLVAAGRMKELYSRVSGILRHYIEDRFQIRAPEQTTEEFLAETRSTDHLSGTQAQMLHKFLSHCDQVKFARYAPSIEETDKTFTLTRDFIDATRAPEIQVDVTDQSEFAADGNPPRQA